MGNSSNALDPLVVVLDAPAPPDLPHRARALSPRIEAIQRMTPDALRRAHVVYTTSGDFDPDDAPDLRWVQVDTAAVNHLANTPLAKGQVPVANVAGAYTPAVAEFTLGLMLSLTRKLTACHSLQLQHKWLEDAKYPTVQGVNLHGKTLGIVGYGSIGRHLARIAQAIGVRVLACKRNPRQRRDDRFALPHTGDPDGRIPEAWFGIDEIETMFARSDAAAVILPLTDETRGLIDGKRLDALKRGAYLVNVGRGGVVDEHALAERLRDGRIAGAGIDVFAHEPLEPGSPLWGLDNVLLAPHIASYTVEQQALAAEVLLENLRRELDGRPLVNVVDMGAGY